MWPFLLDTQLGILLGSQLQPDGTSAHGDTLVDYKYLVYGMDDSSFYVLK